MPAYITSATKAVSMQGALCALGRWGIAVPREWLCKEEEGEHKEEEPQEAHDPAASSDRVNADGSH